MQITLHITKVGWLLDDSWQNLGLQIFICFRHFFVPLWKQNEKNMARPGFELMTIRSEAESASHYPYVRIDT